VSRVGSEQLPLSGTRCAALVLGHFTRRTSALGAHIVIGHRSRRALAALLGSALAAAVLVGAPTAASAATTTVTFKGVSVTVPEDWPVIRLDGVAGCVRFDQHAVYVGDPGSSTCPATVAGHVEAVHLTRGEVLDARSPKNDVGAGRSQTGGTAIHPDLVVSDSAAPVRAVVTSGDDPALAETIADSVAFAPDALTGGPVRASAPAPQDRIVAPAPTAATRTLTPSPSAAAGSAAPTLQARAARAGTTFTGLGFDTCLTPSLAAMQAWAASPYRAVNMYVGGASRGCPNQPNLNSTWVSTVVAHGWTLIPTYVGLQAPCATQFPNRIATASAAAQGASSADDAINVINAIGLGVGSIVYFDMEAYNTGNAGCLQAVQTFLDAWTAQLHARGYLSGVYTSSSPMGPTLAAKLGDPAFHLPDDIWFARWNVDNGTVFGDPSIPDTGWANHQRIHQYLGGHTETWGGVSINIDNNRLDADTAPGAPLTEGTFLSRPGDPWVYRIAGGAPLPLTSWATFGSPQPVEAISATRWKLLPTFPRSGSFLQGGSGRVFQVVDGVARFVPSWDAFGGPQPTTLVDQAALDNAGSGGVFNHLKRGAPAVVLSAPSGLGVAASTLRVKWVGAITAPAIRNYDVRYRRSSLSGSFSGWSNPKPWQNTTASGKTKGVLPGFTYCFQVRATSRAGQTTGWSHQHCAARALDDRSLTASSGWKRWKSRVFYNRTVTSTTRKGATLSVRNARAAKAGVVATTCAACGRLSVIVKGKRVGTISLVSPTTVRRAVLMIPRFGTRPGPVTLKVLTGGRRVQVDGLVVSRI
jgi:hypothetical protein